jgi:hypothetical protein
LEERFRMTWEGRKYGKSDGELESRLVFRVVSIRLVKFNLTFTMAIYIIISPATDSY